MFLAYLEKRIETLFYPIKYVYSGWALSFASISSKVSKPSVAPNLETTDAEFTEPYISALPMSLLFLNSVAQKVEAKASPAPSVEITSEENVGQ